VTRRTNGDVLALGSGKVTNGSLAFTTAVSGPGLVASQPGTSTLERLHIGEFEGTLVGARVTVPDAKDTAQVRVAKATMKGKLTIDADRILVEGKLSDVQAEVADYQGGVPGASMDLRTVGVSGGGAVKLDSQVGLSMDGAVKLDVDIAGGTVGSGAAGVGTNVADGSRMIMTGNHLAVTADALQAKGAAEVDLKLTEVKVGAASVKLQAREATVRGKVAEATLDSSRGVELVKTGTMHIDATLSGGQISFGDGVKLALAGGTKLQTALTKAVFDGAGLRADFAQGTSLDAELAEGSLELPGKNGKVSSLKLGAGSKAKFKFEKLSYDSAGKPVAAGRMELTALLNEQRLGLSGLEELTGLKLNQANLERASVNVNGNFDLRPDSFALTNLEVRMVTALSGVSGRL
jgi:hypothetical protein